jgi:hypothetical protein
VTVSLDEDALFAAADLVGRTGAKEFTLGYLHDDVPAAEAGWYAYAQYKGARITEEGAGPVEAAEALARRLLAGGKCTRCGGLITLSGSGAFAYEHAHLADGTTWTAREAAKARQCRWTRLGKRWEAGCQREKGSIP